MESAPYLEGDNWHTTENLKSAEINKEKCTKNVEKQEIIRAKLFKTEEEIVTLRQDLNAKILLAEDLKRQLSITVIVEMKDDAIHSNNEIKDSNTYKVTSNVMETVKDKQSDTLDLILNNLSTKPEMPRNSNIFRSSESKIGTVYTPVKKEKYNYKPGDKIFAKVKGFVFWPARVNPIPEDIAIPPNKIPIFFYGTHEVYFISPSSCWPYDDKHKRDWGQPHPRANFNLGIDEIENNPTLFQYGVDPNAEEWLSQFYKFKRSNGDISAGFKVDGLSDLPQEDSKSTKSKKGSIKTRNASGSSASTRNTRYDDSLPMDIESAYTPDNRNDGDTLISVKEGNETLLMKETEKCRNQSGSSFNTKLETEDKDVKVTHNIGYILADVKEEIKIEHNEESMKNDIGTIHNPSNTSFNLDMSKRENVESGETNAKESDHTVNISKDLKEVVRVKNSNKSTKNKKSRNSRKRSFSSFSIEDNMSAKMLIEKSIKENQNIDKPSKEHDLHKDVNVIVAPKQELNMSENMPRLRSRSRSVSTGVKVEHKNGKIINTSCQEIVKKNNLSRSSSSRKKNMSDIVIKQAANEEDKQNAEEILKKKDTKKEENMCDLISLQAYQYRDIPNLRSKSISTSKMTTKRKPAKQSQNIIVPEVINSDDLNDEDFQPTIKSSKKAIAKTNKNNRKNKGKGKLTKKNKKIISDVDSLSSISSIENWKEKDEKRRTEREEVLKEASMKELLNEELAIKQVCKQTRQKSNSRSSAKEDNDIDTQIQHTEGSQKVDEEVKTVEVCPNRFTESSLIGKEVIVEISITDIGKTDQGLLGSNNTSCNETKESVDCIAMDIVSSSIQNDDSVIESSIAKCEESAKMGQLESKCPDKAIETTQPNIEIVVSPKKLDDIVPNKKSKGSVSKKQKVVNNRKRKRVDSDHSEDEHVSRGKKKRKLSHSIDDDDSDIEMLSVEMPLPKATTSPVLQKKVPFIDTIVYEAKPDRIKALQTFNSDIRSSLVLGHEDYGKCLDRFRSLCTMDIDLMSLVSVWQLMDTVKKCRRYKRNEAVMAEAQNVYKRFLDIYSRASPEALNKAQSLLAQPKVAGSKTDAAQNQSMPASVSEMFHQHNTTTNNANNKQSRLTAQEQSGNHIKASKKVAAAVVDSAEEKMRLLSADLEAKVSDILNKIEKNTVLNRQSLTHLLPSRTEQWVQELPDQWHSVTDNGGHSDGNGRLARTNMTGDSDGNNNDGDDDDDDDDEEAIVKRIENVPINQIEGVDDYTDEPPGLTLTHIVDHGNGHHHNHHHSNNVPSSGSGGGGGGGLTSALDARIENIFNSSFKDTITSGASASSNATKRHTQPAPPRTTHTQPAPPRTTHSHRTATTTNRYSAAPVITALSPPHKSTISRISIEPSAIVIPTTITITNKTESEVTKMGTPVAHGNTPDNSIYDLLGV